MSSKIKGLRRVGIVGLSTVVVASMVSLSAASSFAAVGDYKALTAPIVTAPSGNAGNLTLEFANSWNTGSTQSFTVGSNNCTTAAGIAAAIRFTGVPTVVATDAAPTNDAGDIAAATLFPGSGTLTGSSAACITAGVNDKFTITQAAPSTGVATDNYLVTLSNINYTLTATTPKGNVNVATAGSFKASGSVANAVVPIGAFTNTAKVLAIPGATASLGSQTLAETTPGAFFGTGNNTVTLKLSTGVLFTNAVTPTITVTPATYSITAPVASTAANTYSFVVVGPGTLAAATVKVTGLTITAPTARRVALDATVGAVAAGSNPVVDSITWNLRTGGSDRYSTAAQIFDLGFGTPASVVLSGGGLFPDALSANYLAGQQTTGTLLTPVSSLSAAARAQIVRASVSTVFITGGTAAVSDAVQNQIDNMHVGDVSTAALINTVRLGGATRYETNLIVNENNFTTTKDTVILANGQGFADALAMGPVAYKLGFPMILTRGTTLGATEKTQLADFSPSNVVIAGGTTVVSQAIEDSLKLQGKNVLRLGGLDRTLTAAAIAKWATEGVTGAAAGSIGTSRGFFADTTYVTTGTGFADAVAAGPLAGSLNRVIVLSGSPTALGAGIPFYLGPKVIGTTTTAQVSALHALGQTAATSVSLMIAVAGSVQVP